MKEEKKNLTGKIIKFAILVLIIAWIILFLVDYMRARKSEMPLICISKTTKKYDDGNVEACTSLGYKVYKYNRASVDTTIEFGPFFMKERTK